MPLRPLSQPSEEDVRRAREGDAAARMRVRVQLLRIRKRDAEIERENDVSADSNNLPVLSAVDDCDHHGDYGDDDCDNDRYVRIPSWCPDVLCLAARARPFVLARRIAISGLFPVRTKQHA